MDHAVVRRQGACAIGLLVGGGGGGAGTDRAIVSR
jgi:hypothetical protein